MDDIETYRQIVEQKVALSQGQGGWEGSHLDFKLAMESRPNAIAKLTKHILAFANTPRIEDAFIIFGVDEKSQFAHQGVDDFPKADSLYSMIIDHTNLAHNDIVIDDKFRLDGKVTPYVVIHQLYRGPYFLTKKYDSKNVVESEIYVRYGKASVAANERDKTKMQDWANWAIDIRYAANQNELMSIIKDNFSNPSNITQAGEYVRFQFNDVREDSWGKFHKNALGHAYPGVKPLGTSALDCILTDGLLGTVTADKYLIASRFTPELLDRSAKEGVRCIKLEDIFFKDDPYAKYCKAFLRSWEEESETSGITRIIDLDYKLAHKRCCSIATFLETALQKDGKFLTVVSGDFGTGKSITAKYITAELARDYLKRVGRTAKVIYINLHDYDIRSRTQDIVRNELEVYHRMKSDDVDHLVGLIEQGTISLVFDSVDEMAKPYSSEGRREVMSVLRTLGNDAPSIYFVRSTYFKSGEDLKNHFAALSSVDISNGEPNILQIDICDLSDKQVDDLLRSRIVDAEKYEMIKSLKDTSFKSILRDPLVVTLVADFLGEEGEGRTPKSDVEFFRESPVSNRVVFLDYLLERLLKREQKKRGRHTIAKYFDLFFEFLYEIAFRMVCQSKNSLSVEAWDQYATQRLEGRLGELELKEFQKEAADAFRTMAWVHRNDSTQEVSFRNDLLMLTCAAKHVLSWVNKQRLADLEIWKPDATEAVSVTEYAACLTRDCDLIEIALSLERTDVANVRSLLKGIISNLQVVRRTAQRHKVLEDGRTLGMIGRSIVSHPALGKHLFAIISESITPHRFTQFGFPLLVRLNEFVNRTKGREYSDLAKLMIPLLHERTTQWLRTGQSNDIGRQIKYIKSEGSQYFDRLLLNEIGVSQKEVVSAESYTAIFESLSHSEKLPDYEKRFVDRSIEWLRAERRKHT